MHAKILSLVTAVLFSGALSAADPAPKAFIDGHAKGWRALTEEDFVNVNCSEDTWSFEKDGLIKCTGKPKGVIRTKEILTNLELVVQWRHLKDAGNSGVFLWAMPASIKKLEAGQGRLPSGIEVQVLDLGYAEYYKKRYNKPPNWFTSHGDVFSTGGARIDPFPPVGPKGRRSFPTKNLTKGVGEWNHII